MQSFECTIGGRSLIIETGKLAGQADAAVTVKYGETVVLVTVCVSSQPRAGVDFLPLTIDYEERLYAAGKIPGGFIRREGRPSQEAILACRLTDRPLRTLLPKQWRRDIQIAATVLSADQQNDPDILALIGGSAVLTMSSVPFAGPVSAVRVGYIEGEMVLNPTLTQMDSSGLDLIVASTRDSVVMVEAGAKELPEDIFPEALKFAHEANQDILNLQEQLQQAFGKPKEDTPVLEVSEELEAGVAETMGDRVSQVIAEPDKKTREDAIARLGEELVEKYEESFDIKEIAAALEAKVKADMRAGILSSGKRLGGRAVTEVRPISCEVGLLPRTHGSGLFSRGYTQVLTITTLGSARQEQPLDGLGIEESKRYMHHYNFPPFSTGEVRRMGSPGRREIGHGALAERALLPVIPAVEDFPYTLRLVSEVLSSSGSTSMGSVCASSLSLMDAGVPIKAPVSGIAMGLITGDNGESVILTDIEGMEDFYGDMDFKVAGTKEGVTALQMDIKIKGVSIEMLDKVIIQSREARLFILDKMQQAIGASRPEISAYAPQMHKIKIDPDKIGSIIGTGGKTIRSIIAETKATIDVSDDGTVVIGSPDAEAAQKAIGIIESLTKEAKIGDIYTGKVSRILGFGAMIEILPGREGMVHISELAENRVDTVEDVVKIGDEVTVKVIGIDNMGRVNLSRRALLVPDSESSAQGGAPASGRPFRNDRPSGGRQGGDRGRPPRQGGAPGSFNNR